MSGTFQVVTLRRMRLPVAALVRELHEELGIRIPEPTDSAFAHLRQPDFDCHIWIVREWRGTPHLASDEHDDLGWWYPNGETGHLSLAVERLSATTRTSCLVY